MSDMLLRPAASLAITPYSSKVAGSSFPHARVAWAVAGILALSSGQVFAQTATGSIYGDADPGTVVTIKSTATGATRSLTVGTDGKFTFTVLPPGSYTVSEEKGGSKLGSEDLVVTPGQGSAVVLAAIEEVVVTGATATHIDTSTAQVYTTFSAQQMEELPVPKDIVSFATLAPGATRGTGDSLYSSLPSISGSGISENTYYINGFNVTNLYQNLAYAQLPFNAIDSEQIITGGYGPEYGMATGGVISLQTKKGTNTWEVGGQATYDPGSMRAMTGPTTYAKDGSAYQDYSKDSLDQARYDVWVGGPLIKDKLFIFAALELQKQTNTKFPESADGDNVYHQSVSKPFGMVNVDWLINDRNSIEATYISNQNSQTTFAYTGVPGTPASGGFYTQGAFTGSDVQHTGGWIGLIKYTGNLTDNLTLSAQYGQLQNNNEDYQVLPDGSISRYSFGELGNTNVGGCATVTYTQLWQDAHAGEPQPSCYISSNNMGIDDGSDTRRAGRVDLSYKLALPLPVFATQTFSAGYDFDRWSSKAGSTYPGGARYSYYNQTCSTSSSGCNLYTQDAPYDGDYVRALVFQTNALGSVHSDSFYLKDDVQVTKNLLVQVGVRNDSFSNINGSGESYLEQKNIWQPRFGFVWDPEGNAKSKLYGSYGIYTNPVTAGVAVRGASASLLCYKYYQYTAINPVTGVPTLGQPLANNNYCINGENGATPAPGTFAASNLSPTKNQEIILGFQQSLGQGWTAGIKGTYTNLQQTIDDYCDFRGFYQWAAANNVGTAGLDNYVNTYGAPCMIINPGSSANLRFDVDGSGKLTSASLTPAEIGVPAAKRRYVGVDLTLDKAWNGTWFANLVYTWSHQYGNTEGTSESDNSQADIGTTENFDYPQIMEGSYGDLPNDHRHTFKAQGAYRFLRQYTVTGNLLVQTGKPVNCIGYDADADGIDGIYGGGGYGAVYHFCDGQLAPRGTAGRLPTLIQLDLGFQYAPSYAPGFLAQVQVYNVFNKRTPLTVSENAQTSGGDDLPTYLVPLGYQPPRSVEFSVKYQFDFK